MAVKTQEKAVREIPEATILFAGDSGDGMQLAGGQFTLASAYARNDLATLPDFPAEIRAPAGTTYGVSGFQLHFGSVNVRTPGDEVDVLVAMNPAALKVSLERVRKGGTLIVNADAFGKRDLDLAGYSQNPLEDDSLKAFRVVRIPLAKLTHETLSDADLDKKTMDRCKNMFALGLALWMYSMPIEPALEWLSSKFARKPDILEANRRVLKKGNHYGETVEEFAVRYEVRPAKLKPGKYRAILGTEALAMGLIAASRKCGLPIFYGSYPITPASEILHELSRHKNFGVKTFQAEDEIAAAGAALGASFGGYLGVTATSGPGLALKSETIALAVMAELPLVIVNMQRGGPSTGLPTKTEQADLLQALFGRNGEAPLPVIAPGTPGDCFYAAFEACRIAIRYMTPVILLSDGYLGTGSEPWLIPNADDLEDFTPSFATAPNRTVDGKDVFLPYVRDEKTLARPWAKPGTAGLEHRLGGLEKEHETGNVSYEPENHEYMVKLRAEKVERVAQDIPPLEVFGAQEGDLLVVGWGSTQGAIETAVDACVARGLRVGAVHLRHLAPLPNDLGKILSRYEYALAPELNNGQLVRLLRERFLLPVASLRKIKGLPFKAREIEKEICDMLGISIA